MSTSFRFTLGLIITWALLVPIAFISSYWYIMVAVIVVSSVVYVFNYIKSKKVLAAFLSALTFGIFFALAFWILLEINHWLNFTHDLFFIGSFFVLFIITSWVILAIPPSVAKRVVIVLLDAVAITAFVLLIVYRKISRDQLGHTLLMGGLIGFFISGVATSIFHLFVQQGSKIFGGLTDYIMLLVRPFMIFFVGYLCIAFIYAGIYNIILQANPAALHIPEGQIAFVDLILYSLDTMTTGGNSEVSAETMLSQTVNTLNVFTAIIWMTVMLAATIAYTSESFSEIQKKHKGSKSTEGDQPTITSV